jgi:hypothetical protein
MQYDILYGVVWGVRTALKTGVIIEIVTLVIGILIGSTSAYYGGRVDNWIMRFVDIFMTLPFYPGCTNPGCGLAAQNGQERCSNHDRPDRVWLDGVCPPDPR